MPLTPYLSDILSQPQAVRDTVEGLRGQALPGRINLLKGDFRRVVLTGMGSSYTVFYPLYQALVNRGFETTLAETSELIYGLPGLLREGTLVIAASQSGRSAEIVSLIARKRASVIEAGGFAILGVSNTPGSPLDSGADGCVFTRAGEEATVSCKTYLATLLALAWLEPVLCGESAEETLAALELAAPALEAYLADWQAHVNGLKDRLKNTRDLFIVGRGPSLAAAGTGGLIIKESTHFHAEGMSSAAFRHGPVELVSPETFVLVMEGPEAVAGLNRKLYADILAAGGSAGLVSRDAAEPVFRLPEVPGVLLPLVEILPVQMITLALAELRGHEVGRFTLGSKVTTVE